MPAYHWMDELIDMMEEPNRSACHRIIAENRELFQLAPGSTHNHQDWEGGYWDHVLEVMNLWVLLYETFVATGRLSQLTPEEQFSRADGLLVLFLHDIEKPWRCLWVDGRPAKDKDGHLTVSPNLKSKAARKSFAERKIRQYGIVLSPHQANALRYVEGIRDEDYTPDSRIMLPLAALCHTCDLLSARMFYDFPRFSNDAWGGGRITGVE